MLVIHYKGCLKPHAQTLRRESTHEENHLWYDYLRSYPIQFRRQKQFGRFIVDFYCAKAKLVVELDGSQHGEEQHAAYDRERTQYLEAQGLQVVRFSNREIKTHFVDVCDYIHRIVKERIHGTTD